MDRYGAPEWVIFKRAPVAFIPADTLSRPANMDQGEEDNKNVIVIKPQQFKIATASATKPLTEEDKRQIMSKIHDHPLAGHPGRDETIRKTKQ